MTIGNNVISFVWNLTVLIPFLLRSWRFYWGRHAHLHVYLCGLQLADLAGMFDFSCHIHSMVCHSLFPVFHHILWLHIFCDLNRIFMVKVRSGPWKKDPRYGKRQSEFLNVDINTQSGQSFHYFLLCLVFAFNWIICENFLFSIYIWVICVWQISLLVYFNNPISRGLVNFQYSIKYLNWDVNI